MESLENQIRELKAENQELSDAVSVWQFKFKNQELIKKHSDNEELRKSWMNIMVTNKLAKEQSVNELAELDE